MRLDHIGLLLSGWLLLSTEIAAFEPDVWLKSSYGGQAAVTDMAELETARQLFMQTFKPGISDTLIRAWQKIGFELSVISYQGEKFAAIRELPGQKRGRGAYLVRLQELNTPLLQAPHRYFDKQSGKLLLQLFLNSPFKAAAWNTVHRKEMDLARLQNSYFTAFAQAHTASLPGSLLVQVHGYSTVVRKTDSGRASEIIISAGHKWPGKRHYRMAGCLQQRLTENTMLYPIQTPELGGTRNPVGHALHDAGFDNFLHLELSASLRQQLVSDRQSLNALALCLMESR